MEPLIIGINSFHRRGGKTKILTELIEELSKRSIPVAVIKSIHSRYDLEKEGIISENEIKDTKRFRIAGAKTVIGVTHKEIIKLKKFDENTRILEGIKEASDDVIIVFLEGFKHSKYSKIFLIQSLEKELDELRKIKNVIAVTTTNREIEEELMKKTDKFIPIGEIKSYILEILKKHLLSELLGKNCGRCGFKDCKSYVESYISGKSSLKCIFEPDINVKVNDERIPLKPFVKDVFREVNFALIHTLKNVPENSKIKKIEIKISL